MDMQYEPTSPMERAHHPRPFGCGLRVTVIRGLRACTEPAEVVTVISVRTRTVVDAGPVFSSFATVVATTTSDSESEAKNLGHWVLDSVAGLGDDEATDLFKKRIRPCTGSIATKARLAPHSLHLSSRSMPRIRAR